MLTAKLDLPLVYDRVLNSPCEQNRLQVTAFLYMKSVTDHTRTRIISYSLSAFISFFFFSSPCSSAFTSLAVTVSPVAFAPSAIADIFNCVIITVEAKEQTHDFYSRFFAPKLGTVYLKKIMIGQHHRGLRMLIIWFHFHFKTEKGAEV